MKLHNLIRYLNSIDSSTTDTLNNLFNDIFCVVKKTVKVIDQGPVVPCITHLIQEWHQFLNLALLIAYHFRFLLILSLYLFDLGYILSNKQCILNLESAISF